MKVYHCVHCGKPACANCYQHLPTIDPEFFKKLKMEQFSFTQKSKEAQYQNFLYNPYQSSLNRTVYFCSSNCINTHLLNHKAKAYEYIRDQTEIVIPLRVPFNPHMNPQSPNYQQHTSERWIIRASLAPPHQAIFDEVLKLSSHDTQHQTEREKKLEQAKNLELAHRLEDSAKIYEELNMWEDAGRVRRKAQQTTTMSVDVNELLEQLKQGGITTTYKCTNCGATIPIDGQTDANGLKFCGFCGTAIQIHDLTEVLKKVL